MAIFHGTSIPAKASGGTGYGAEHGSIRLNSPDSAYLTRTPATETDRQKYTLSFWMKRAHLTSGGHQYLFSTANTNGGQIYITNSDERIGTQNHNHGTDWRTSERKLRDISHWYHIVVAFDSTLANADHRIRMYINGVENTDWTGSANPSQNSNSAINCVTEHMIGNIHGQSRYFDGYLAQYYFIDGQQLTPDAFGETGTYGEWRPKEYTGTYGTNGYYLPFNNSGTKHTVTASGNAQHSTTEKKMGASSMKFDGSGDYLTIPDHTDFNFDGDYTLEFWFNVDHTTQCCMYSHHASSVGHALFINGTAGKIYWQDNSNSISVHVGSGLNDGNWHHVAIVRNGSGSNNQKMYIDGTAESTQTGSSATTQSSDVAFGQFINGSSNYFNGYLDEIRISNNARYTADFTPSTTAFTADSNTKLLIQSDTTDGSTTFTDSSGAVGGLGNDASGNENHWTLNNITASDHVLDCPANNYAVLNSLDENVHHKGTYEQGNLLAGGKQGYFHMGNVGTMFTSNKIYGEFYIKHRANNFFMFGIAPDDYHPSVSPSNDAANNRPGKNYNGVSWEPGYTLLWHDKNQTIAFDGSITFDVGDIFMQAFDPATGKFWAGENGTWWNSGNPETGANPMITLSNLERSPGVPYTWTLMGAAYSSHSGDSRFIANFGQDSTFAGHVSAGGFQDENGYGNFKYQVPAGFLSMCSANLPEPAVKPAENFSATIRSGNNNQAVTGIGFQPDLVWNKTRNAAHWHQWHDSVRGPTAGMLNSNQQTPEDNGYQFDSFDSDGFTVDSGNLTGINASGYNYVTWAWKADGSGSSNSNGSITSTVSANTSAGFSIVSYTGNGISGATIGHGLSQTPDLVIVKDRDDNSVNDNWFITSSSLTNSTTYNITLADIYAETNAPAATSYGGGLALTNNSVLTPIAGSTDDRTSNESGDKYIAYCFHNVEGYSKIGTYHATYQTDGPFIYTGFRPAFVMTKSINNNGWWVLFDTARSSTNPTDHLLAAHTDITEKGPGEDTYKLDIVSNGFKLREQDSYSNASGTKYIYIAFAEQPFKYTTAR